MTPEEHERMNELCNRLQVEQDNHTFTELVAELNNLLERKEGRLEERDQQKRDRQNGSNEGIGCTGAGVIESLKRRPDFNSFLGDDGHSRRCARWLS